MYLEVASDPTGEGLSPTRLLPSHVRCQLQVAGYPQLSELATNQIPTMLTLGSVNLLESLTELRETLTITSLLNDVIKDTGEQPYEKLSEPHTSGIFMEASSHRHGQLLTPFPTFLPSLGKGVGLKIPSF